MQGYGHAEKRASPSKPGMGAQLDSWKEIASFFRKEVRTVQLWEKSEGLPIHRHHHKTSGSVYAYRFELEEWRKARSALSNEGLMRLPSRPCRTGQEDDRAEDRPSQLAYRLGQHFWMQRSPGALLKAAGYFRDAIEMDPSYAPSHAGFADCCVSMSFHHLMPPSEATAWANIAATSAVRLDPASVAIRNCMTNVVLNCNWNWSEAERHSSFCIEAKERNSRALQLHSTLTSSQGRHKEAIASALSGLETEPHSPAIIAQLSFAYYFAADYDRALASVQRSLALNPGNAVTHALLGMVEAERGNCEGAVDALENASARSNRSSFVMALKAYVYAHNGERTRAATLVRAIEDEDYGGSFPAYDLAAAYTALDQHDRALTSLRKAHANGEMKVIFMKQDPKLVPLRRCSAFQELASAMRLV